MAGHVREWEGPGGIHAFKGKSRLLLLHSSINPSSLKVHSGIGNTTSANDIASQAEFNESPTYPIYRHPPSKYALFLDLIILELTHRSTCSVLPSSCRR